MDIQTFKNKILRRLKEELTFEGVTFYLSKLPTQTLKKMIEEAISEARRRCDFVGSSYIEIDGYTLQLTVKLHPMRRAWLSAYLGTYEDLISGNTVSLGTVDLV